MCIIVGRIAPPHRESVPEQSDGKLVAGAKLSRSSLEVESAVLAIEEKSRGTSEVERARVFDFTLI